MSLPDDVLWEILSWLSPKPLIKFRLVSQSWYDQIADPSFINKHQSNYCGDCDDEKEDYFPKELEATNGDKLRIHGSFDGLLCCWSYSGVYLYNPSIRRAIHLPHDAIPIRPYFKIKYLFGYDDSTHDIKLVKIDRRDGAMAIYSTNKNTWEKMNNVSSDFIPRRIQCVAYSVFFGGSIYWCGESTLVAFDLPGKKFRQVPYPPDVIPTSMYLNWGTLSIAKGSLHFMTHSDSDLLRIWKMKQDVEVGGDMWVKIFEQHKEKRVGFVSGLSCQGSLYVVPYRGQDFIYKNAIQGSYYAWMSYDWETEQYKDLIKGSRSWEFRFIPVKKTLKLLNLPGHFYLSHTSSWQKMTKS